MLLRGCGQWFRCGSDRVARPTEQENLLFHTTDIAGYAAATNT